MQSSSHFLSSMLHMIALTTPNPPLAFIPINNDPVLCRFQATISILFDLCRRSSVLFTEVEGDARWTYGFRGVHTSICMCTGPWGSRRRSRRSMYSRVLSAVVSHGPPLEERWGSQVVYAPYGRRWKPDDENRRKGTEGKDRRTHNDRYLDREVRFSSSRLIVVVICLDIDVTVGGLQVCRL